MAEEQIEQITCLRFVGRSPFPRSNHAFPYLVATNQENNVGARKMSQARQPWQVRQYRHILW